MMTGHQYARSLRAHFLTQTALGLLITNGMDLSPNIYQKIKEKFFDCFQTDPPTNEDINSSQTIS